MSYGAPTCVVCLLDLSNNLSTLTCGHIYHTHCITQCLANGTKVCPLCRVRFNSKQIVGLQYILAETEKPSLLLDENDLKDGEKLSQIILNLSSQLKESEKKIENLEELVLKKEKESLEAGKLILDLNNKLKVSQDKYFQTKNELKDKEANAEHYKSLFTKDHLRLREAEDKLKKLESIQNMKEQLDKNHSSIIWANNARETLPIEDQASQFYSALLISTSNLKSLEDQFKQLKNQHGFCNEEIQKLKKTISTLRKENEQLSSDKAAERQGVKRTLEMAGLDFTTKIKEINPASVQSSLNLNLVMKSPENPPKKALSLLKILNKK